MTDVLEGEELVASLRQLVISFRPYIQEAGSAQQAEQTLLHLEEVNENFHKFDFVKRLKNKIDNCFDQLIEEELEQFQITPQDGAEGQEAVVNKITDAVISSREYKDLMYDVKKNVGEVCEYMSDNFDEVFNPDLSSPSQNQSARQKHDFSDGESSFGDSSLNQSTFMFMNPEQFNQIADGLSKNKSLEKRKEAMQILLQTSAMEAQNSDVWPRMRQGLLDALTDPDQQIWTLAMKFIARGFSSSNPSTRDLYTVLLEFISMQFNTSNKSKIPKVKNGIDSRRFENAKLLKAFRMMNDFQLRCPTYWIRYPDKFLEEILESTLSLLAIHYNTPVGAPTQMTPAHFLALVDPRACWFVKWMHGNYSRNPLLQMLARHKSIVDNAVRVCLEYVAARKVPFDLMSDASEAVSGASATSEGKRSYYSGPELEYVYFVQSIHLLTRILCFKGGRSLFPVKVKDRDEAVTVTHLVVSMVQLLTAPTAGLNMKSPAANFDPGVLVTDVFRKLCSVTATCRHCICRDSVTNALLAPISHFLDGSDSSSVQVGEWTLLQIADILSMIASCAHGRHHLLYGQSQDKFTRAKSSAAHILAEFSQKGLANELPKTDQGPPPSKAVIGNFVYVVRQLYTTCEGLLVLSGYDFHDSIASAWREACREADSAATPTPSMDGGSGTPRDSQYIVLWEDMLRDNLLNFAGTPKGLLLLQQTGAIDECVAYMYSRYARRLQVSKCEKYGYGYMMSQVLCTAVGTAALQKTGFIKSLIRNVWGVLEIVHDKPMYHPIVWPVHAIDKNARKPLSSLMILLSSFQAVYEVLADEKLPTKEEYSFRELPTSLTGLFDRIVFVNTEVKMHSLFNYEQCHVFGLRLLSTMVSCLDTLILLQTQYKILNILLKCQDENKIEGGNDIIIDALTVERNYILVKSYLIGGASERLLPTRTLSDKEYPDKPRLPRHKQVARRQVQLDQPQPFAFPLFTAYPVPREYIPNIVGRSAMKQENDLGKYLSETKKAELNPAWLDKCRKAFCSVLTTKPEAAKGNVLQDLLERAVVAITKVKEDAIFPLLEFAGNDSLVKSFKLTKMQEEGINVAIRYGTHLKLLSSSGDATDKLTLLIKQVSYYLKQQQRAAQGTSLECLKKGFVSTDWFVATIFLMMNGNTERAWKFLQKFSSLASSAYLWLHRLHASVHLQPSLMQSGISPIFSSTCHNIELILQDEVSHVHSAFMLSGYTPAQICQHWIRQCFWNYLDWTEICHYVCVCTVLGVDYQVYMCVAILRHQQRQILHHQQQQNLINFLKEEPLRGFKVGEHLEYMQQLENKFRKTILPDMLNVSKP